MTIAPAGGNTGGNSRQLWWDTKHSVWYQNQESCQTWDTVIDASRPELLNADTINLWQPGIALRVAPGADGTGVRAVTVAQNVWGWGVWIFWVYLWDIPEVGPPF